MADAAELQQLEHDLRSKSEEKRKEAYRRVLDLGESAVPTLVRWLADSNSDLREAAYESLRRHPTKITADALIERLKSPDAPYRMVRFLLKAISLLEVIPDPRIPEVLSDMLKNESDRVVNRALIGLRRYAALHLSEDFTGVDKESIANRLILRLTDSSGHKSYYQEFWIAQLLFILFVVFGGIYLWSQRETEYAPFLLFIALPIISIWVLVSLFITSNWTKSHDTRNHSIRALRAYGDGRSIGILAIQALKPRVARSARAALATLLDSVKEDRKVELSKGQMNALMSLLKVNNRRLRKAILRAMPVLADEAALVCLEDLSKDEKSPLSIEERRLLTRILPKVRERTERLKEKRILLRAAHNGSDEETLLRPANYHPELANETLLRSAENENVHDDNGSSGYVAQQQSGTAGNDQAQL